MKIISKKFQEIDILFSKNINESVYINATETAKRFNKDVREWKRSKQTTEYIEALSDVGFSHTTLIKVVTGNFSDGRKQGTWIHKKLIIVFARWLSPKFAVWCDSVIEEILKTGSYSIQPKTEPIQQTKLSEIQEIVELYSVFEKLQTLTKGKPKLDILKFDNFLKSQNRKSILEILNLDFSDSYFSVSEIGEYFGKSGSEINQDLAKIGFQILENGVWEVLEDGKEFCFETQNRFSQLKWKFEVLERI